LAGIYVTPITAACFSVSYIRCTERLARPCGQPVVKLIERVVSPVTDQSDQLGERERVTRDAHRRLIRRFCELRRNREL
jgi:hypothetical protein